MAYGEFNLSFRGTIVKVSDLKETKSGKQYLDVTAVINKPFSQTGEFFKVRFYGPQGAGITKRFAENRYRKGDIICLEQATEQVDAWVGQDGKAHISRVLLPKGTKKERKGEDGQILADEDGKTLYDFYGGYEIIPYRKADTVPEPDPEQEREAVPPKQQGFVEVDEELPF